MQTKVKHYISQPRPPGDWHIYIQTGVVDLRSMYKFMSVSWGVWDMEPKAAIDTTGHMDSLR